jgi:hypothetical protein
LGEARPLTTFVGAGVPFEIMNTICPGSAAYPADYRIARDAGLRQDSDDDDDEEDDDSDKDEDDEGDGNNGNDGYSE